ncbi:MAG: hypothetical protein ACOX7J_09485 [Bacillota bacterium]|jgi:hypothetical protein
MKKIVFWITVFVVVLAVFFTVDYYLDIEAHLPEPDPVMLEVDKPLYYSEMPEAEDIPLDQYPCDLTLIIEAIEELDEPLDESSYHISVDNYSYDGTEISGSMKFIGYNGNETYFANISNNVLDVVYYVPQK